MQNREEIIHHLRSSFLFEDVPGDQLKSIADFSYYRKLKRGTLLFRQSEQADAFFIIVSGLVKVYRISPSGDEHVLEITEAPAMVAEAAIFDRADYPAFCEALEETLLIKIPKRAFLDLLSKNWQLTSKLLHSYSKRLRYFVNLVHTLTSQDVKTRLLNYMVKRSVTSPEGKKYVLTHSKKELASQLGTIPETLSRAFRSLKSEGLIDEKGKEIYLRKERM